MEQFQNNTKVIVFLWVFHIFTAEESDLWILKRFLPNSEHLRPTLTLNKLTYRVNYFLSHSKFDMLFILNSWSVMKVLGERWTSHVWWRQEELSSPLTKKFKLILHSMNWKTVPPSSWLHSWVRRSY